MKKPEIKKTEKERTQLDVLFDITEALNQSIGACGVLLHMQEHYGWAALRDGLEATRDQMISRIQTTKFTKIVSNKIIGVN